MLALICAGVVATIVLVTMPVFVAGIVSSIGLGDKAVGWLASADMAGGAIACILVLPIIAGLKWHRVARIAIVCAVAGNLLSVLADSLATMMLIRVLTGFANGLLLAMVFVGLCHSCHPDRYFGIYVFAQLTLQVVLLAIFPGLISSFGMTGIFLFLAGASAMSMLLVSRFPETIRHRSTEVPLTTAITGKRITLPGGWAVVALLAQALYFLAPAAIWGYLEPIGGAFALDIGQVGHALSVASIAGIAGAAAVVVLGTRFDRLRSMGVGVLISLGGVPIWLYGTGFGWYLVAAILFSFAWNFTFPYQMGVLARFDQSGDVALTSLIVQLGGLAFGPMLASFLVTADGYNGILWASTVCYVASLFMFAAANHRSPNVEVVIGAD